MRIPSPQLAATFSALTLLALAPGCTRSHVEPGGASLRLAHASERNPSQAAPRELLLERVLPLDVSDDFEPSGLLLVGEHLLVVSDKHDDSVFELVLGAETVEVRAFIRFEAPPAEPRPFDFEGLTLAGDGALLLVSEARHRVLSVSRAGSAAWVTPSLQRVGLEAGLFRKRNAAIEGIARLDDGRIVLAAEREPRGLLELPKGGDTREALAWAMPDSIYPTPDGRSPDFADLTTFAGGLYAIERNSHLIVRLERSPNQWLEREAWSYAKAENDPRFAYQDRSFGLAEGVALDASRVFLVFDNNRDGRRSDASDRRPLLFVFKRPT